jgi:spore coat protein JB
MRKIQELAFVKTETELYLDGHPDNKTALDFYHKTVGELSELTRRYENKYGPITAEGSSAERWNWVDSSWPWHVDFEIEEED